MRANRVTIATVEKFITDRQAQGMNIGTLRKVLVTLGQILNYAVRHKYIEHNPLREAERPGDHVQRNEALQTQLGHASPSITLNVYAHLMNPTNQEAACRLENSVFEGSGSKMVAEKKKGSRSKSVTP